MFQFLNDIKELKRSLTEVRDYLFAWFEFISAIENFLHYAKQKGMIKDWRIEL